jgi:hypothetical protein
VPAFGVAEAFDIVEWAFDRYGLRAVARSLAREEELSTAALSQPLHGLSSNRWRCSLEYCCCERNDAAAHRAILGILFICLIVLDNAVSLEIVRLLTPDRHGLFTRRSRNGGRCCSSVAGKQSRVLASQPLVPELTRRWDIKL